jgi:hypothetical protein
LICSLISPECFVALCREKIVLHKVNNIFGFIRKTTTIFYPIFAMVKCLQHKVKYKSSLESHKLYYIMLAQKLVMQDIITDQKFYPFLKEAFNKKKI